MNQYRFELVGLQVALQTPGEISISPNLQPFLTEGCGDADCVIELHTSHTLPPISGGGVWHGPSCYHWAEGAMRIFHCHEPQGQPFAVTEIFTNGNIRIDVLPAYMDYFSGSAGIFNRIGMETMLLQHHGLLLHASLIDYKGKAIAFTGPSGVGKSTQADLWRSCLGADVLNGDRAALRKGEIWTAYGSPYAGTSGIYKNQSAPLAAIIVLGQARENQLRQLTATEAFAHMYPELSAHRWDKAFMERVADLCLQLLADVPVYRLDCRPEESAVRLVKKGLGL